MPARLSALSISRMLLAASRPEMCASLALAEVFPAQIAIPTAAGPAGQQVEVASFCVPLSALAARPAPPDGNVIQSSFPDLSPEKYVMHFQRFRQPVLALPLSHIIQWIKRC